MNNFVVEVLKKFDLVTDLVCYAKIFLQIYTAIPWTNRTKRLLLYINKYHILLGGWSVTNFIDPI
jgi:hypothetical protein